MASSRRRKVVGPSGFVFTPASSVATSSTNTHAPITISGLSYLSVAKLTGTGTFRVNAGSYSAADKIVQNGDTVEVQVTASASASTAVSATLTINAVSSTYTVTTTGADTTAPVLTSPTGTQTGSTTATLGVLTNEGNGTLYAFVSTSSTPPSAATLKAGTGAVFANSQTITTTGSKAASATGLTASTAYYVHWLHRDTAGNDSAIVSSPSFTTTATGDAPLAFTLAVTTDSSDNTPGFTMYWATAPILEVGDVITIEAYTNSGLTTLYGSALTYTLVTADLTDHAFDFPGTAMPDNSYWFRGRITRGSSSSAWSNTVAHTISTSVVFTALPTLSGTPQEGVAFTATTGTRTGAPTITDAYQWKIATTSGGTYSNASAGTGAATLSYTPAAADVGKFLKIEQTATNSAGSVPALSLASTAITSASSGSATTLSGTPLTGAGAVSNGNRTYTTSGTGVVLTNTAISGKKAFAVSFDTVDNYCALGVCDSSINTSLGIGNLNGVAHYNDGTYWNDNSSFGAGSGISSGNNIACLVDATAKLVWFTHDGTTYYGSSSTALSAADVAAGTGGASCASQVGSIYGAVAGYAGSNPRVMTLLAVYPFSLPSGYTQL